MSQLTNTNVARARDRASVAQMALLVATQNVKSCQRAKCAGALARKFQELLRATAKVSGGDVYSPSMQLCAATVCRGVFVDALKAHLAYIVAECKFRKVRGEGCQPISLTIARALADGLLGQRHNEVKPGELVDMMRQVLAVQPAVVVATSSTGRAAAATTYNK
jgi:hypothetical protein